MIFDLIDCIFGLLKMCFYKLVYPRRFYFHLFGKYSADFQIRLYDKGTITIGKDTAIKAGTRIRVNQNGIVKIGNGSGMNYNCLINAINRIQIGNDTILGQGVMIYDHDHNYRKRGKIRYTGFTSEPVSIGNNVWIGSGCIILKGTNIGDNCMIGGGYCRKG